MSALKELVKRIDEIPGNDGFWRENTKKTFREVGIRLRDKGFDPDEVIKILTELYAATAEEFGG